MPTLKGTALMPKGDKDGFTPIADDLEKDPLKLRAALIIFNARRGTTEYATTDTALTIEIVRGELLLPQDLDQAEVMLRRALEFRSGQTTLEFDLEDEVRRAFEAMKEPDSPADPENPEDPGNPEGKGRGGK